MMRLVLVNMPFADWTRPAFALSQFATLVGRDFPGEVETEVRYLNQDFGRFFGLRLYDDIAQDLDHLLTGVGDWLFRHIAFPDEADNADDYFRRYYRGRQWTRWRTELLERRAGAAGFLAELIDRYDLADADVVGLSSMFNQHAASIALAQMVKERNPGVTTVIGGANCEVPMGAVIAERVPALDYVFSGPSLRTFPALLRALLDGRPEDAETIPGILTRDNCRDPRFAKAVGADLDIDDVLMPDYDAFAASVTDSSGLFAQRPDARPVLYFETSRGCWWGERSHCTFCGLNGLGMNYRAMSAEHAIGQFEELFRHASWCTTLTCTDNIMPKSYPKEVFAKLRTPPDVSIFYEIKIPVSEADMRALAAGGVTEVQPGIEALATTTLKLMAKGTTSFQNLQFMKNCLRYGITPAWNLLIGFPGEPEAVYEKYHSDLPALVHLPPPTGVHMVRFDRYSPYFMRQLDYGLRLRPMDFYQLVYPFADADLAELAYFFADEKIAPEMLAALRWSTPLKGLAERWRGCWEGDPPRLVLEGGTIVDSRFGMEQRLAADDGTRTLLRHLSSPRRTDRLAEDVGDAADRLGFLREHQLVFEESGRALSLVLDPTVTWEG